MICSFYLQVNTLVLYITLSLDKSIKFKRCLSNLLLEQVL